MSVWTRTHGIIEIKISEKSKNKLIKLINKLENIKGVEYYIYLTTYIIKV